MNDPTLPADRARGDHTQFTDNPMDEALLDMVMALLGEVCVLRDRLDAQERLHADGRAVSPATVDAFIPGEGEEAARQRVRNRMIAHVMRPLRERLLPDELTRFNRDYREIFEEVQRAS